MTGSAPHHTSPQRSQGFSLVELLVAAVLMLVASMGGTVLFNQATQQANAIRRTLEQQFAISADLASIIDRNDRYTCSSGTCMEPVNPSPSDDPPNQNGYVPSNPQTMQAICQQGLADALVTSIGTTATAIGPGVMRTASFPDNTQTSVPPHRYTVTWKSGDRVLRQVQLIPTVAGWCP